MKFLDQIEIEVTGGKGGNGCVSFRRERFIPYGGPDGGNGGQGGSVYLTSRSNLSTLADFQSQVHYRAESGSNGGPRNRTGSSGDNLYLSIPNGTEVYSATTSEYIAELTENQQQLLVAQGGRGGVGNHCFKSGTNRSPKEYTLGQMGETHLLRLSLKLLADVGLLGLPNAGKSTFIQSVSNARPKIADYPFTTLVPQLGVVRLEAARHFVIADIPGLIKGAAAGAGLGLRFLKHLERTRLLLHLVDIAPSDGRDPIDAIRLIWEELSQYSESLVKKPCWIVFNKLDNIPISEQSHWCNTLENRVVSELGVPRESIFMISSLQKLGTMYLSQRVMQFLSSSLSE